MIILLAKKNAKFHFFKDKSLKHSRVIWDAESEGLIFIKVQWFLGGVLPFLENKANSLRLVACDG